MTSKFSYGVTIFLGAFLLFQIEPLIAKRILPWFGGVAAIWIVCLLFFQVVLLLGYAYAHWLARTFRRPLQARIHIALLAASILFLPVYPRDSWAPVGPDHPTDRILLLLAATIGLPYLVLSSTGPLLQKWYAGQYRTAPYRFYALSNIASMLALLSYPVLVEPWLTTRHQALTWSSMYALFAVFCAAIALSPRADSREPEQAASQSAPPTWKPQLLWIALAACGSALLLSVTNYISQNIASVPFLWILPLSLYLLTFILCFAGASWYPRSLWLRFLGLMLGSMAYALSPSFSLPLKVSLPLFCTGLFVACMFCHGELARLRPDPRHLTSFYMMLSLGGALGALFVALIAPRIFAGLYELHVALGLCALLVVIVHAADPQSEFSLLRLRPGGFVLAGLAIALIASLSVNARADAATARFSARNFYGLLRIVDGSSPQPSASFTSSATPEDTRYVSLMNGTINHGLQFLAANRRRWPTTYYGPDSGIGVALKVAGQSGPLRVGIIGLGAGTTAAYGRFGDHFTYYEINPLVIDVTRRQFTFLQDSPATIDIVQGDARLSLQRESPKNFDVLAVDAFTGDSIPVHLLTREAFELYFRHLQPNGILAVHVSNRYLNLQPVVAAAAVSLGKEAVLVQNADDYPKGIYGSNWVLVGKPGKFIGEAAIEADGNILSPAPNHRLWTDDFSNLFQALK